MWSPKSEKIKNTFVGTCICCVLNELFENIVYTCSWRFTAFAMFGSISTHLTVPKCAQKRKSYKYIFPGWNSFHISPVHVYKYLLVNQMHTMAVPWSVFICRGYRFRLHYLFLFWNFFSAYHISVLGKYFSRVSTKLNAFLYVFTLVDLRFDLGMVIKTETWIIHNWKNFNYSSKWLVIDAFQGGSEYLNFV